MMEVTSNDYKTAGLRPCTGVFPLKDLLEVRDRVNNEKQFVKTLRQDFIQLGGKNRGGSSTRVSLSKKSQAQSILHSKECTGFAAKDSLTSRCPNCERDANKLIHDYELPLNDGIGEGQTAMLEQEERHNHFFNVPAAIPVDQDVLQPIQEHEPLQDALDIEVETRRQPRKARRRRKTPILRYDIPPRPSQSATLTSTADTTTLPSVSRESTTAISKPTVSIIMPHSTASATDAEAGAPHANKVTPSHNMGDAGDAIVDEEALRRETMSPWDTWMRQSVSGGGGKENATTATIMTTTTRLTSFSTAMNTSSNGLFFFGDSFLTVPPAIVTVSANAGSNSNVVRPPSPVRSSQRRLIASQSVSTTLFSSPDPCDGLPREDFNLVGDEIESHDMDFDLAVMDVSSGSSDFHDLALLSEATHTLKEKRKRQQERPKKTKVTRKTKATTNEEKDTLEREEAETAVTLENDDEEEEEDWMMEDKDGNLVFGISSTKKASNRTARNVDNEDVDEEGVQKEDVSWMQQFTTEGNTVSQRYKMIRERIQAAALIQDTQTMYECAQLLVASACFPLDKVNEIIYAQSSLWGGSGASKKEWSVCWGLSHRDEEGNVCLSLSSSWQPQQATSSTIESQLSTATVDEIDADNDGANDNAIGSSSNARVTRRSNQKKKTTKSNPSSSSINSAIPTRLLQLANDEVDINRLRMFYSVKRHPQCPRFALNQVLPRWRGKNICTFCKTTFHKRSIKSFEGRVEASYSSFGRLNHRQLCTDELIAQHDYIVQQSKQLEEELKSLTGNNAESDLTTRSSAVAEMGASVVTPAVNADSIDDITSSGPSRVLFNDEVSPTLRSIAHGVSSSDNGLIVDVTLAAMFEPFLSASDDALASSNMDT